MSSRPASAFELTTSFATHDASGELDFKAGRWAQAATMNARATSDWLSLRHSSHSHTYVTTSAHYHRDSTDPLPLHPWSTASPPPFDIKEALRWPLAPASAAGDIFEEENWSRAQHARTTALDEHDSSLITSTTTSCSLFGGSDSPRTKAARRQYAPLPPAALSLPPSPSLYRPTFLCEPSSVTELPLPSLCDAPVTAVLPLPSPLPPSSPLTALPISQLLDGAALSLSPLPVDFTAAAATVVGHTPLDALWTMAPRPSSSQSLLPSLPGHSLAVPWTWPSTLSPEAFALSPIPVLPPAAAWNDTARFGGGLVSYSSDGDGSSSSSTCSVAGNAATIGVVEGACSSQHEAEQLSVCILPPPVSTQPAPVQQHQQPPGPVSGTAESCRPQRRPSLNCHQCKHSKVGNSYKCQRSEQNKAADATGGNTKLCKKRYCESATQTITMTQHCSVCGELNTAVQRDT